MAITATGFAYNFAKTNDEGRCPENDYANLKKNSANKWCDLNIPLQLYKIANKCNIVVIIFY